MNAETTLQPTFDDPSPADETPFSSRLRAVWLVGLADSSYRPATPDDGWDEAVADLVEVTPAFGWVS
jgi:hypothetical protein